MIKSWKHKGLRQFYETGSKAGINSEHVRRLTVILQLLNAAEEPDALNLPGLSFHKLTGQRKEHYSVRVNGNWRVIYKFDNKDAVLVDYLDYH
ncbi:MAG: type II toxin-antitoxin system RelE/ParE family toxin [Gammaproteobacteria bacterium]|nr:type II toxin-antitoxin system RelE/ParE family toxin [Gammaproteobacteria bacterium]